MNQNMRTKLFHFIMAWLSPCLLVSLSPCLLVSAQASDDVIDSPMYRAPELPEPPVVTAFPDAKELWLKALARPEADLRCKAADTIALAHRRGMKGLETTIAPLVAALERPDQHPSARLAAAQALITLDARCAAPSLFQQAQSSGLELRNLIEPALARWEYRPARVVWLERLRDPATLPRQLILAIRGLGAVREEQAAGPLREWMLAGLGKEEGGRAKDDQVGFSIQPGPSIVLEAARTLGLLQAGGLEEDAERLAADTSARGLTARLAAASLLERRQSARAIRILQRLAGDEEPSVAARAVARLIEIDPKLAVPMLDSLLSRPDATLRSFAVEILLRQPTQERIHLLAVRLDDAHPDVRAKACRALRELAAKKEFRERVITEATRVLAGRPWRGLEQATILLTWLDHKPAAGRLVELLRFERPEVFVTAAWGLRKLAVRETLAAVASYAQAQEKRLHAGGDPAIIWFDHQLSQLNQFLGEQRYREADTVLRPFIPREPGGAHWCPEARAAAAWALGLIHEGKRDDSLATALLARLNDTPPGPPGPDNMRIRRMAAITLARLRHQEAVASLRKYCPVQEATNDPVHNACGWAIEQLTGKVMPPPRAIQRMQPDWFLIPAK
jgi:HEAT repeat protein